MSEIIIKAIDIQEKIVLSVAMPMVKNNKPRIRQIVEICFLFIAYFFLLLLENLKSYHQTAQKEYCLTSIQKNQPNTH